MKNNSIIRDWKTRICLIPVVIGILFFIYLIILVKIESHSWLLGSFDAYIYSQMKSNFGDFVSGTVGILFMLTATFFLFVTMAEQRQQTFEARVDNERSRYESTYFNMLAMLGNVITSVDANLKVSAPNGIDTINAYYRCIKKRYEIDKKANTEILELIDELSKDDTCIIRIQKLKEATADIFEHVVDDLRCNVGYFYRYIYNAIMYVEGIKVIDETKKKQYLNILKAQLSDEALALLMYDAMSKFAQNKEGFNKFKDVLDRLNFFENIQESVLLERCHYKFYPKTYFRFLNTDELIKVQK